MKSSIVNTKEVKLEIIYPCVMQGKESGVIVLFNKADCGVTLVSGSNSDAGETYTGWDMDCFTPWSGTIKFE